MNLFDVYSLYDIEPVRGEGCYVYDRQGRRYLDLYGGHAVISIGHAHPRYVKAVSDQVAKLGFYSNSVINSLQNEFAHRLGKVCGYDDYSVFLCNSGAEANENAIKLASFHTGKHKVLAFDKAFHGRTSGAVAATDNAAIISPFNRTANVEFARLNDIADVERHLESGDFCAVIIEGIQGVAGIRMADDDFMRQLRELTAGKGVVLIADEIQAGYGRTGCFFAHNHAGIRPDLITCAKGIANGFPMGGVIISPEFVPAYGQLGTTFGGNHLACATAIAVLEVFENENLVDNSAKVGQYLLDCLKEIPGIKEVRGRGLMIGIEMDYPVKDLRKHLIEVEHVFTGAASTNIIRLLPPLCLTKAEADEFIVRFKRALAANGKL